MKFLSILFNICHFILDIISDLFASHLYFLQVPFYIFSVSFMSEILLSELLLEFRLSMHTLKWSTKYFMKTLCM